MDIHGFLCADNHRSTDNPSLSPRLGQKTIHSNHITSDTVDDFSLLRFTLLLLLSALNLFHSVQQETTMKNFKSFSGRIYIIKKYEKVNKKWKLVNAFDMYIILVYV